MYPHQYGSISEMCRLIYNHLLNQTLMKRMRAAATALAMDHLLHLQLSALEITRSKLDLLKVLFAKKSLAILMKLRSQDSMDLTQNVEVAHQNLDLMMTKLSAFLTAHVMVEFATKLMEPAHTARLHYC